MRQAPIRALPVEPPAPAVKPVEAQSNGAAKEAAKPVTISEPPRPPANPEYVFRVSFNTRNGEERHEEVKLGPDEIAEAFLDGIGHVGHAVGKSRCASH
jgi:hypothetical protein